MTIHRATSGGNGSSADDDIANLFTDDDAASIAADASGGHGVPSFSQPTPAGAAKKVSEVLGEVVWLMSQSPLHKQFFISDLEWFAFAPVLLKQFRLFYAKERPIDVVFWAHATPEVAERLASGTTKMRPQDWNGKRMPASAIEPQARGARRPGASAAPSEGQDATASEQARETQTWIVEVIAPFGGAEEMVKDLKANVFADEPLRYVATTPEGKKVEVM